MQHTKSWVWLSLISIVTILICHTMFDFAVTSYVSMNVDQQGELHRFLNAYANIGLGWPYVVGFFFLFVISRFKLKNDTLTLQSLYLFLSVAISGLACDVLKLFFGRPRPQLYLHQHLVHFTFLGPHAGHMAHYASFPSGHATTIAAVAVAVAFLWQRWRMPMLLLMLSVSAARVLLLRHFVSDVIAGMLLGGLCSFVLYRCFYLRWQTLSHNRWRLVR